MNDQLLPNEAMKHCHKNTKKSCTAEWKAKFVHRIFWLIDWMVDWSCCNYLISLRVWWPPFMGSLTDGYCRWRLSLWHARFSNLQTFSIPPQDALGIKMQWIFDASLACFSFWTHSGTVCESSSLSEVTFSFSTASSQEWSHKTVYATLTIINLLAHIGLDGATEDSIFEV